MALTDRFTAPPPIKKGPGCSVGKLLLTLPKPDAKALVSAMRNNDWAGTQIADALRAEGWKVEGRYVAAPAIQRHRRGQCLCEASS